MIQYKTDTLDLRLMDCMDLMREYPDKHFDLAIVDPPYGIGEHGKGNNRHRGGQVFTFFEPKKWDNDRPTAEYWCELIRVSQNQIVWGGNYFVDYLKPSMGWIFWDKLMGGDFSDGELAYTSFERALRKFTKSPEKNYSTNAESAAKWKRIHPCQKPVALYRWLLANYAKEGMKILDTHLGSMSHAIAAHYSGVHLTGCELDPDYFAAGIERVKAETAQMDMFADSPKSEQTETMKLL
jgi:site-specific DNA-methyltransferase (adenine-specific)